MPTGLSTNDEILTELGVIDMGEGISRTPKRGEERASKKLWLNKITPARSQQVFPRRGA
jgi:hypothetical protein